MKKYSQEAFRDGAGDIWIKQYSERALDSGLIVPQHIGNVAITSTITSAQLAAEGTLHYASSSVIPDLAPATPFSLEPLLASDFHKKSTSAVIKARIALTYSGNTPNILHGLTHEESAIDEEDVRLLKSISSSVEAAVNDKSNVLMGQYL